MKHLKYFESTEIINDYMNIKKYVVWRMKFYLIILEVLWCDTKEAGMKRLYSYSIDSNYLKKTSEEIYTFGYPEIIDKVVFDSDNLEDCLDDNLLASLKNSIKFNI